MTAAALTNLPFQAGGAVAAAAGRGALWAIGLYMRQPLRNSGVVLMVGLSSMAMSNALYFQTNRHPAPMFGVMGEQPVNVAEVETPAIPPVRPKNLTLAMPDTTTTGSVAAPVETPKVVGNSDVFEIQKKLKALGLFNDTVDGLYGKRTASAIKAFEERQGLKQTGQLTPAIVETILAVQVLEPVAALPDPEPLPEVKPKAAALTIETPAAAVTIEALPAPAPLDAAPAEQTGSIDAATGTQVVPMSNVTKRVVQPITIKVNTQQPAAEVAPVAEAAPLAALEAQPAPQPLAAIETVVEDMDSTVIEKVQRGLASLGFLHTAIDGVAGEATAKAVRNFEVYYRYDVTGRITPELVNLLVQNGAQL